MMSSEWRFVKRGRRHSTRAAVGHGMAAAVTLFQTGLRFEVLAVPVIY